MNHYSADIRRSEAASRRNEREAKQRQREFERQLKEHAKLSALEQARLEVKAHENALDVLLSVHKEQSPVVDWRAFASALPPHEPPRLARHDLAATGQKAISRIFSGATEEPSSTEEAGPLDEREYEVVHTAYEKEYARWEKSHLFAQRILAGEARAYAQAVSECSALAEIAHLGSSLRMRVHDASLIVCELEVKGREVIPAEVKSLTAGGKVSVKPMPKARFHEIYQDYVCGCVLRLAREMFALLPVEMVLATATVEGIDSRTGHTASLPVLSLAAPRIVIERLDFERIDPSESLVNFQHRGEVMASRKSGEFVSIVPLTPPDVAVARAETVNIATLNIRVRQLRTELAALIKPAATNVTAITQQDSTAA